MLIGCEDRVICRAWIIRRSVNVPSLGTRYSHIGNKVFPRWECSSSLKVVNKQRLSINKGALLQNKGPLLQHKEALLLQ